MTLLLSEYLEFAHNLNHTIKLLYLKYYYPVQLLLQSVHVLLLLLRNQLDSVQIAQLANLCQLNSNQRNLFLNYPILLLTKNLHKMVVTNNALSQMVVKMPFHQLLKELSLKSTPLTVPPILQNQLA